MCEDITIYSIVIPQGHYDLCFCVINCLLYCLYAAMGECQECKTIRTNLDNITQLISSDPSTGPTWFAQKLEEKAFISNAAGAVVTGLTKYEQVSKLLGTVKGKISISQEPEREFAKFIEILQSDRPLLDLAKKLLQDCGEFDLVEGVIAI